VGKTSVAATYARRHLAEMGVAWRLAAEDPTVLAVGFAELAAQLEADLPGTSDPVTLVHRTLATFPQPWLLIFDNAPDRAAVERFLPPAGQGRVLVTSRNPNWPPSQLMEIPELGTEAAAGFLTARTGDRDDHAAGELAAELGGLPLALEQAGAYIHASVCSLTSYLESFRHRRPEILARGQPTGYASTVAATWSLAFEELEHSMPLAVGLLRLLAFCAPEPVPLRLLLQAQRGLPKRLRRQVAKVLKRLRDPLAISDAIAALRQYSLVTPAAEGLVSVHRLVQAVTVDQTPPGLQEASQAAAAAVIEAAIPVRTTLPAAWPPCALLLPHARAALDPTSRGTGRIAQYLGSSGSYAAARDMFKLIAEARMSNAAFGPEHPGTLIARGSLANWTGAAGDAADARDHLAALLPHRGAGPGPRAPQHPEHPQRHGRLDRAGGKCG
jgi:hypothetical protein